MLAILLSMAEIRRGNHLRCMKPVVDNGIFTINCRISCINSRLGVCLFVGWLVCFSDSHAFLLEMCLLEKEENTQRCPSLVGLCVLCLFVSFFVDFFLRKTHVYVGE